MRPLHVALLSVLALLAPASGGASLGAQAAPVSVHGVAFDSLRNRPLAGAFVTIGNTGRSAQTDDRGRFHFDSVAPGRHLVTLQHASLDALGISGVATHAIVADRSTDVAIASPSFATLWKRACGDAPVPASDGFIYGTVSDVQGTAVSGASVDVTWIELGSVQRRRLVQRLWRGATRTNEIGSYSVCGVPTEAALRVQATTDSASSGMVDLPPEHERILRRDLRVAPHTGAAGARRGDVVGFVTDSAGNAVVDARVAIDEAEGARTDSAGRFHVRGVPTGTRQLEVLALGMSPATAIVDVPGDGVAEVGVRMRRITTLDIVRVTASPTRRQRLERLDERRRLSAGYFRDSSEVGNQTTMSTVLASFPSVYVEYERGTASSRFTLSMRSIQGNRCEPAVWVDGTATDVEHLGMVHPSEIAVIEVYPRSFGVPPELTAAREESRTCGAVALWTRSYLK